MASYICSIDSYTFRKLHILLLALFWTLGLGFGDYAFSCSGSILVSQMPLAASCQPSIFGLLTSFLLPFLFSAFAVYLSAPKLLYLISFGKSLVFGFVSAASFSAFPNCGWLVHILLLFTDICGIMMLCHYWLRHISGVRCFSAGVVLAYLIPLFGVALADYYYISPLLQRVLL